MKPNPLFIFPDDVMAGRVVVETVTSEAGPFAGPVTLGASNDGDLLPNTYAHEVTADYAFDFGLVRAGGTYRSAEWKWKNQADGGTLWRGVDQINWTSNTHDPFGSTSGFRNVLACCFAKRLNTIFCYWMQGSGTITCRYRSAGGDPTSWTTTSFTLSRPVVSISAGGMAVFELPDGTMRMLVITGHTGAADNDVDVYSSTDGMTWTLASRNVISQAGVGLLTIQNIRAAMSGDWIRLIVLVAGTTYSLVSSDRGASFGQLTNFTTPIPTNAQTANAYSLVDLVGLDDYAGTFLCFYNDRTGTSNSILLMSAARDEDFSAPTLWSALATDYNVFRVCATKTATHVLVLLAEWNGAAGDQRDLGAIFCERNVAGNGDVSDYRHFLMGVGYNSAKQMARSIAACEADGGAMVLFGLCDPDTAGAEASYGGAFYVQQWTSRAMWADETITGSASEPHSSWDSTTGDIGEWASSLWTTATGASATRTWLPEYTRIASSAAGAGGVAKSTILPGATPPWADGANMVAEWVVRQPSPGAAGSDDRTAVRFQGKGTTAGISIDFSIRHLGGTQAVLYDNGTNLPLATVALSLASYFYVGRASVTQHDAATWAEVAFARVDQMGSLWSVISGTLHTAVLGIAAQTLQWGHLTGVAAVSSDWRRFAFARTSDWHQAGFINPTSLRGAPVSARPWYVSAGVWVDWSGGAGFEFDTWLAESRHRNEVDNLFLPSPQATWRSTSLASNQIVLDSSNAASRSSFSHDGFAMFGANVRKLRVAYSSTNGPWSAPAQDMTLYSDLVAGLSISVVNLAGALSYVDVTGATLDEGAYVGKWLHMTNGAWANASITIASQVGNRLYFGPPGWTSVRPSVGDSAVIHGSVLATLYAARRNYGFMLLETSGQTTAAGYYELGLPVAGVTSGLDGAAVDWQHAEATVNGVEVSDGVGGVRWAFEATPPRRRWEGSISGDAIGARRTFERQLRTLVDLSVKPFAMMWDRDDLPATVAPVRYVGDVEFANDGWRQAANGTWYPVGNADVRFDEEL